MRIVFSKRIGRTPFRVVESFPLSERVMLGITFVALVVTLVFLAALIL